MRNQFIAALLGALTVFVCGFVVYGALGLHLRAVRSFTDSAAVSAALVANAPESGMYFLPAPFGADGARIDNEAIAAAAKTGPWAMVSIRPGGFDMMDLTPLWRGFLIEFFAALIAACIVSNMRPGSGYGCRVMTVASLGAFAGLVDPLLMWNFMADATAFSVFTALTHVGTWLLGGLVIARFARPAAA